MRTTIIKANHHLCAGPEGRSPGALLNSLEERSPRAVLGSLEALSGSLGAALGSLGGALLGGSFRVL